MFNNEIMYEYPHSKRVIVIGDVHGDVKRFKNILIDAKVINKNVEWIANPPNTIVVQLGDQVDSLNRDQSINDWEMLNDTEMIHFTNFLNNIAITKGGKLISLIGNHELMNVIGNYSYVSPKSLENVQTRQNLYKPGGSLSPILGKRPIIVKIGELLFCHAGLKKSHVDILNKYNKNVSYLNVVWRDFMMTQKVNIDDKQIFDDIILGYEGILWNRELDTPEQTAEVFKQLGCVFMFIGHNTVDRIKLLNNLIWYVDTGLSRAFGTTSYQYIDIDNYNISVKTILE
jgi:hypothetical protein